MEKDFVFFCKVHNRYQHTDGHWYYVADLDQDINEIDTPCDHCDDPSQIVIEFEEI